MVKSNNQRKAFLDMPGGRRELITDVRKPKSWDLLTSLWAESYLQLLRSPRKLVTLNPKLKSTGAGRLASCWWDAYRKQLGLKDFSPKKVGTLQRHCSRLRAWRFTMIDRGDIRQAIDRCSNIWASLPGAGYGRLGTKADSLIAKIQRSGRNGQKIDVWAKSPRLSPLWLSAYRHLYMGC